MYAPDMTKPIDVTGIGNAILDVLSFTDDAFIQKQQLRKGDMMLIDEARAAQLYSQMGQTQEVSGGSVANSLAGIAMLGGKAAFIGRVNDDQFGKVYRHDLTSIGVQFDTPTATGGKATGVSYILVTPDGERTMNTYLGAGSEIYPEDIDPQLVVQSKIVFAEGYQWCTEHNIAAIQKAFGAAKASGSLRAFTLSAVFCVEQYREQFQQLLKEGGVDILFANEAEAQALYPGVGLEGIEANLRQYVPLTIITMSEKGSMILTQDERIEIAINPVEQVTDATGAGDLYASGFLFGLTHGYDLKRCGELGSECAAQIIQQLGARSMKPLKELAA